MLAKFLIVLGTVTLGVGCGGASGPGAHHPGDHGGHHWSYAGETGPAHWGELKEEFSSCKTGQSQSPIDIAGASGQPEALSIAYKAASGTVVNNGHTVQVNLAAGSQLTIGSASYPLVQFHFHAPSEHTVGAKVFPMEVHFVHKTADGKFAVLGVLIEQGQMNAAVEPIWSVMPSHEGEAALGADFDPSSLLPADKAYYHYEGSLTTPPCSEAVSWNVIKAPIQLSAEQIEKFKKLYPMNARPVQPVNSRKIQG